VMQESEHPVQSQDFVNLVTSDRGKAILERYGFSPA